MTLLALIVVPILIQPVFKYRAEVGVELGTAKILFKSDLSIISSSSWSSLLTLYQTSELLKKELKKREALSQQKSNFKIMLIICAIFPNPLETLIAIFSLFDPSPLTTSCHWRLLATGCHEQIDLGRIYLASPHVFYDT